MKHILITGVSTGIGYGTAKILINNGYHVFGSVRKPADAERVKTELGEHFTPLIFDVTKQDDVLKAAAQVKKILNGKGLDGLVNNAGIAIGGPLLHTKLDDLRWQMEVNVVGLVGVTQAFAPLLGAYKNCPHAAGKIINISSAAGKITSPFLAAYSASKHAVEAISHGFRRELQLYGIDVVIVGPGPINTPIIEKFPTADDSQYKGTDYENSAKIFEEKAMERFKTALPTEDVGKLIMKIFKANKPKTRYAILHRKFINFTIPNLLPDRTVDKFVAKEFGLGKMK
jgi:NAD(P)-dependent dehydrogenase (short-subunit alcohol dehydrogenase family)